jgi:hypothetical protein
MGGICDGVGRVRCGINGIVSEVVGRGYIC